MNHIASIVFAVFGLCSSTACLGAQGPSPNTTPGEQAAIILGEAFVSLMAAIATKSTCNNIINRYGVTIHSDLSGSGYGILNGTIKLEAQRTESTTKGAKYQLIQIGEGSIVDNFVKDYKGEFNYSFKGDILIGKSSFYQKNFGVYVPWQTSVVDEFWGITESKGLKFKKSGIRSIFQVGYPRSKWMQNSDHSRPNIDDGNWVYTAHLKTPNNTVGCSIILSGKYDYNIGSVYFTGYIIVKPATI